MTLVPARAPRRFALAAGLFAALYAGILFTGSMARFSQSWIPAVAYIAAAILSGTATVWVSRGIADEDRRAWLLIGLGTISWALGDISWAAYDVFGRAVPYPGVSDLFYLAAYPLWLSGVVSFPHARGTRFGRWRLLLDGAAGTAALALLMWHFYLKDVVSFEGSTFLERLVNPLYPIGDVFLLAGLVILSVRRSPHRLHRPLLILSAGVVVNATADVMYLVSFDTYQSGAWFDGLWVVAYGLFAFAGLAASRPARLRELPDRRMSVPKLLVMYTLVGALMAITSYNVMRGTATPDMKILVLGAGLVLLISIIRQAVAFKEYLEVVERERQDLVATISHELRTPLTAMSGFTDVLASDWHSFPDAERTELLASVSAQTRYLSRIVTDLVEVSRDNLAKTTLKVETHSVAEVTAQAVKYANLAPATDLVLDFSVDLMVRCDRGRLIQILVNLISNAARYGKGEILLKARAQVGGVRLEVHDNGPGVPVKYREVIWERFERGIHRFDAATPGSGVGLAIVHGLVLAHGGTVSYEESELLGGACFVVVLPPGDLPVPASDGPRADAVLVKSSGSVTR